MSIDVRGVCVLLQVFDMPTSVRFYRDVLGFEVVQTSPREADQFDWGLLRLGNAEVMLNTAYEQEYRPAQPDVSLVAGHQDTCLFFGCPDVDAAPLDRSDGTSKLNPASCEPTLRVAVSSSRTRPDFHR